VDLLLVLARASPALSAYLKAILGEQDQVVMLICWDRREIFAPITPFWVFIYKIHAKNLSLPRTEHYNRG